MTSNRHIKRNFTMINAERSQREPDGPDDAAMSPPLQRTPRPAPRLQLPGAGDQDISPMEPPMQPARWKRNPAALAPPSLKPPLKAPSSPHRHLAERVSWSEIMNNSQDDDRDRSGRSGSPQTPIFRFRAPASPPVRMACRRRPLSDDEGSTGDKNEGRFAREFCSVTAIGQGQFSTVYRARNRIDQCDYAVKKTTRISRGLRQTQLREAFALANVSMESAGCPNVVRYYSSWVEDERLHIQTELCECSLRETMQQRAQDNTRDPRFQESELAEVLRHVANGLQVLHGCGYVHLDVKPDNILVGRGRGYCYKIADLGLAVAAMGTGCDDISEGDCRYLAKEVLRGDLTNLPKADVFSLGLVMYELSINPRALPFNGDDWAMLRDGHLEAGFMLPLSEQLLALLHSMVVPTAAERPSCQDILQHSSVAPEDNVKALREEATRSRAEAEHNKALAEQNKELAEKQTRLAEGYWHEILLMKKQELLNGINSMKGGAMQFQGCQVATAQGCSSLLGPVSLRRERTS